MLYPGDLLDLIFSFYSSDNREQHLYVMLVNLAKIDSCSRIWVDSYCKGAIITARIFFDFEGYYKRLLEMLSSKGRRKAIVFPVPVGAVTIKFLFYSKQGMTCIWTGVGFCTPISSIPWITWLLMLYFWIILVKLLRRRGASLPVTLIPSFLANWWAVCNFLFLKASICWRSNVWGSVYSSESDSLKSPAASL